MSWDGIFSTAGIAATGLAAERQRMEVAAHNIANAHATRTPSGEPYRRRQLVFAEVLRSASGGRRPESAGLGGVKVVGLSEDETPFPVLYDPGHPDADETGHVRMPNVQIPHEMVDLLTASRAYEANLKSLEVFRQMTEQALNLLKGTG
jgi:flagellar basal-body rod protein FlgC